MVRLNRIYTRTGDDGSTGLVGGGRVSKADPRVAAYGEVDELNSAIGLALCAISDKRLHQVLRGIQNTLFDLGADLATPGPDPQDKPVLRIGAKAASGLETQIDKLNDDLEPLRSFVLPGGSEAAARLHMARAICRRAERQAVALAQMEDVNANALLYLNRLSDFLFVAARWCNDASQAGDILWVPGADK